MEAKKINTKDIIVVGFALFAMFFGAGNLIFPPYLGVLSAKGWFAGFLGFLFADAGLALLGVIAMTKVDGDMDALFDRAGRTLSVIIGSAMVLCIGPFLAIPRTGATTYEMGVMPIIGDYGKMGAVIFSIIFFAITLVLTIRPSKVVDIIGQFLTPALLVCLAVLIIKGVVSPLGEISDKPLVAEVFKRGVYDGYQTLDGLAACVFAGIIISSIKDKGYTETGTMIKSTILAGVVATVGMGLVYGGLCYLGATVSKSYGADVNTTALVVDITTKILGHPGKIILGIIVALACLTTSIGLTSSCGNFFSKLSKGKLSYEKIVIAVCVFSAFVSNFGVAFIIQIAAPILGIVYPATVTVIFLGLFNEKVKSDYTFKLAVYVALVIGIVTVACGFPSIGNTGFATSVMGVLNKLPLASYGFNWALPVAIAGIIGAFIKSPKKA